MRTLVYGYEPSYTPYRRRPYSAPNFVESRGWPLRDAHGDVREPDAMWALLRQAAALRDVRARRRIALGGFALGCVLGLVLNLVLTRL